MRAVAVDAYGEPARIIEVPVPAAGPGQVLVRVAAASLNPFDAAIAAGHFRDVIPAVFPLILGIDVAGSVAAVGDGDSRFAVGDDVCGAVFKPPAGSTGTLAEFVVLSEGAPLVDAPRTMDAATAAALPTTGGTALAALDAAGELADRTVLIVGASGGVGSFATQIAAARGAHVIGTARAAVADRVLAHGAQETVDHSAGRLVEQVRDLHPDGIDVYLQFARTTSAIDELSGLVRRGGFVGSTVGGVDVESLESRGVRGANFNTRQTVDLQRRVVEEADAGRLVVPALHRIALEEVPGALAVLSAGHGDGKTVAVLSSP